MNLARTLPFAMLILLAAGWSNSASALEFHARVVDGTGHSIEGAVVRVSAWIEEGDFDFRKVELATMTSDAEGWIQGDDEGRAPPEFRWSINLEKPGFQGYLTDTWQDEFVMERIFDASELARIVDLEGHEQVAGLRQLLAGDLDLDAEEEIEFLAFKYEDPLRPALLNLVSDESVGDRAATILGLIGLPDDLRHVLENRPDPDSENEEYAWVYYVATAMLEPETEAEWNFLRRCALNEFDDLWADAGAIQTLQLIASPRSRTILEEVREKREHRSQRATRAIAYIDADPPSLDDTDLEAAGRRIAEVTQRGKWEGNDPPRFNVAGDKAMIDCRYIAGHDMYINTAVYHRIGGVWKLRGVRLSLQLYLGPG